MWCCPLRSAACRAPRLLLAAAKDSAPSAAVAETRPDRPRQGSSRQSAALDKWPTLDAFRGTGQAAPADHVAGWHRGCRRSLGETCTAFADTHTVWHSAADQALPDPASF